MPEGRRAWRPGGKNLILCGVLTRSIATKEAAPDGGKSGPIAPDAPSTGRGRAPTGDRGPCRIAQPESCEEWLFGIFRTSPVTSIRRRVWTFRPWPADSPTPTPAAQPGPTAHQASVRVPDLVLGPIDSTVTVAVSQPGVTSNQKTLTVRQAVTPAVH